MKFFRSLFQDVKEIADSATDAKSAAAISQEKIDSRLRSLRTLQSALDFKWRKEKAEWESASSVEENLKRTPLMRMLSMRRAKAIAGRMASIGRLSNMVETLIGAIVQTSRMREHVVQMNNGMGDPAAFKQLSKRMNDLMAQNREIVRGLSHMQDMIETYETQADSTLFTAAEKAEQTRLNELFEKLETCRASGDAEAERKVQEDIRAIVSGGSKLALA